MIYASNGSRTVSRTGLAAAAVLFIAVTPGWTLEETAPAAEPATLPAPEAPVEASAVAVPPATDRGPVDIALDDARVNVEFESEHISRIAGFVAEYVGINIVLDTRVIAPLPGKLDTIYHADYVTDGLVRYINLDDVALRDALRALCRPLDLTFEARPSFIWISSPELIGSESWPELPADTEGREALESSVSIEFEDEHLSRILDFVSQYVGVNLVLDTRVVAPAAKLPPGSPAPAGAPGVPVMGTPATGVTGAPSEPAGSPGILGGPVPPPIAGQPSSSRAVAVAADDDRYVTTGVVPYLKVTNLSLHEALLALLRPMNLTYRVEHGYIWISTPEMIENEPAG